MLKNFSKHGHDVFAWKPLPRVAIHISYPCLVIRFVCRVSKEIFSKIVAHDCYYTCPRRKQGVPRKNIRKLAGKPALFWTIQSCLKANAVERVFVSTEDSEIRDVALASGAEVPVMRPEQLVQTRCLTALPVCILSITLSQFLV